MSFTTNHLYFEDLEIGQEWKSPGRTITETDIVNFAGLSGDFNPIHVDHAFAATTPYRKPIAHGLLVLAIGSGLGIHSPPMRTVAFLGIKEWYFRDPVFPGDTLTVVSKVVDKQIRGRGKRGEVTWQRKFYKQDGRLVMEGLTLTLVQGRMARPAAGEGQEATTEESNA